MCVCLCVCFVYRTSHALFSADINKLCITTYDLLGEVGNLENTPTKTHPDAATKHEQTIAEICSSDNRGNHCVFEYAISESIMLSGGVGQQ